HIPINSKIRETDSETEAVSYFFPQSFKCVCVLFFLQQPCAVCLEEFKARDELGVCPCSHTFHKKCLLKWLEIRSVCPMCNKPIMRLHNDNPPRGAEGPQDPEEV
uniref:Zgc:175214 n=1 Tax=Astyanax mexicanus TaxID=7994 RepID=A0A8B9GW56_ASTMX